MPTPTQSKRRDYVPITNSKIKIIHLNMVFQRGIVSSSSDLLIHVRDDIGLKELIACINFINNHPYNGFCKIIEEDLYNDVITKIIEKTQIKFTANTKVFENNDQTKMVYNFNNNLHFTGYGAKIRLEGDKQCIVRPSRGQFILLNALTLMLLRTIRVAGRYGLENNNYWYRFYDIYRLHYMHIKSHAGAFKRLQLFDMTGSIFRIPNSDALFAVKKKFGEGSVYQLVNDIINIPIYDEGRNNIRVKKPVWECKYYADVPFQLDCLPAIGDITMVLLDIILQETLDRAIRDILPNTPFTRVYTHLYLPITDIDHYYENEHPVILDIFKKYGYLATTIMKYYETGGEEVPIRGLDGSQIYLSNEGQIIVS